MSPNNNLLSVGNTAKLYCMNWIARYIDEHAGPISLLDLGCGTGQAVVALLAKYPQIRYVGVEPLAAVCETARRTLAGFDATLINATAYNIDQTLKRPFDLVISFSVLEHVYQRLAYMRAAKACLASSGYMLMNYDAGHFVLASPLDKLKSVIRPVLVQLGQEQYHESLVRESEFSAILRTVDFEVVDAKFFNTLLKPVYRAVPAESQPEYMQRWLDFELWLNTLNIVYDDSQAALFTTRNFILRRRT